MVSPRSTRSSTARGRCPSSWGRRSALLVRFASIDWVFIFDAATSVIAVLLMTRVHVRRPERAAGERHSAFAELREGLRFAYSKRSLRYFILIGTATWLGFGAFGALEPLFYRDVLRTGVEAIGWMNTLFGVGILLGAWTLTKLPDRAVSARGLAIGAALVGLGALLYVGTRDIRIVAVGRWRGARSSAWWTRCCARSCTPTRPTSTSVA
jgi:predicted MFS family arabinose efflux permease